MRQYLSIQCKVMAKKIITPIQQVEGLEIANPLYDVVFKRLMENERISRYFIETFIDEEIESITMVAQESTPVLRAETELEWASHEVLSGLVSERDKKLKEQGKALQKALAKIEEIDQTIAERQKAIAKKDRTIAKQDRTIAEQDRTIAEQNEALQKAYSEIALLRQKTE